MCASRSPPSSIISPAQLLLAKSNGVPSPPKAKDRPKSRGCQIYLCIQPSVTDYSIISSMCSLGNAILCVPPSSDGFNPYYLISDTKASESRLSSSNGKNLL